MSGGNSIGMGEGAAGGGWACWCIVKMLTSLSQNGFILSGSLPESIISLGFAKMDMADSNLLGAGRGRGGVLL